MESPWTLEWDDTMSMGIPELDREHRRFICLINALSSRVAARRSLREIEKAVQVLLAHAERHAAREARLLAERHYAGAEDHAQREARLVGDLKAMLEDAKTYRLESDRISAALKIKQALIDHFLNEDLPCRPAHAPAPG